MQSPVLKNIVFEVRTFMVPSTKAKCHPQKILQFINDGKPRETTPVAPAVMFIYDCAVIFMYDCYDLLPQNSTPIQDKQ